MIKWLENYWYHYKWHTIIGLFLAAVIAFSVWEIVTDVDYDYYVMLYTSRSETSVLEASLEKTLSMVGDDQNGDGKVNVQVINASYSDTENNKDFLNSQSRMFMGELMSERTYLIVTDDTRFNQLEEKFENFFVPLNLDSKDGKSLRVNTKTNFGKKMLETFNELHYQYTTDLENGYNISMRSSGEPQTDVWKKSKEGLLDKIKAYK